LVQETLHTHKLEKEEDQATKTINGHLAGDEENVEQHITLTMNKNLFQNWPLISSIVLFCIAAFDDMTYMEVHFYNFISVDLSFSLIYLQH